MFFLAHFFVPEIASSAVRISPDAAAVIVRTRTTQATYALVDTNELHHGGGTVHEFSAEYNQGDLHRVETPRHRIVANCRTHDAAALNIATGEITHAPEIATFACGMYTNQNLRSADVTGSRQSEFGSVDQIKLVSTDSIKTYEVAQNGAIVAETISDVNGNPELINRAISLSSKLPAGDLFSEASLARSVVPEGLKRKASDPGK